MKRMLTTTALAFTLMLVASFKNAVSAQPGGGVGVDISYQTFYDELDPYGRWMDYPDYGYVWIPDAGPDFRPYSTNGHWVWSDDYEWMWVSDYNWGWAPFHYGRWIEDPDYGWIWVPGYEWSPAWVAWRDGGDYYGWAPLRPGINISIGFSLGGYNPPVDYWCFAPRRYITSPRIYDYCVPRRNNITIINNTTIINNYNYNRNVFRTGPGRRDAERYTGRINSVRFRDADRPGRAGFGRNEVSMYRPRVQHDNNRSFAPRKFERVDRNHGNAGGRGNNGDHGNNLPQPRDRDGRGFGQRNNTGRQPGNNNGIADGRRIDRNSNNNPNTPGQRRNIFNGNDNRNSDGGESERNRSIQRRQTEQPANPGTDARSQRRDIFNRNNQNNNRNNEIRERRQMQTPSTPRNQPRQERRDVFNRGGNNNPGSQRQSAPRMEQPRQQQPQQPRQMERRTDNNGSGGNRGGNNGGGHGRRGR